jgi:hypothetical protein
MIAITKAKAPIVPPAIAPTLFCLDLPFPIAALVDEVPEVADAAVGFELEVVLGALEEVSALELELESAVELEDALEDVEVDDNVMGLNVTPVNTTCNKRSVGCPVKDVSTVVA